MVEGIVNIGKLTTFKIGGEVAQVYFPKTENELLQVLQTPQLSTKQPYNNPSILRVFGNLSNTLISSFGFNGAVVLTSKMMEINIDKTKIYAACGIKGPALAQKAAEHGLSGLEFMIGFPGSVGGEIYMNASAHGQAINDRVLSVKLYSREKGVFTLAKDEMEFGYRSSICRHEPYIVLGAEFELEEKPVEEIKAKMQENLAFRKNNQPDLRLPNAGSIFRNPEGDSAGRLLDRAGAKVLSVGGARVWEGHANFVINSGSATSSDVLELMFLMYNKVREKSGVELEPEIEFLGDNEKELELWNKLTKLKN